MEHLRYVCEYVHLHDVNIVILIVLSGSGDHASESCEINWYDMVAVLRVFSRIREDYTYPCSDTRHARSPLNHPPKA